MKEMEESGFLQRLPKGGERVARKRGDDGGDDSVRRRRGIKTRRSRNSPSLLEGFSVGDLDDLLRVLDGLTGPEQEPAVFFELGDEDEKEWSDAIDNEDGDEEGERERSGAGGVAA